MTIRRGVLYSARFVTATRQHFLTTRTASTVILTPSCASRTPRILKEAHTIMSDHLSGPRALADPAIDLTDLYAFPSPSRPGHLVLVMNVFPNARPPALFSDAASYRFRVRPVTITASRPGSLFDVGTDEYALTCTFAAPVALDGRGQSVQEGTGTLPNRTAVSSRVNHAPGGHA